ncbi:hypothetical protein BGX31_004628, partial [Mortierella sp. GBA43]
MNPTAETPAAVPAVPAVPAVNPPNGTPYELRPRSRLRRLARADVPRLDFESDFFTSVRPRYWTFEGYLARGYLDQEEFLHDLRLLANCRGRTRPAMLIKSYCRRLARYYGSEEGLELLGALRAARIEAIQHQSAILHLVNVGFAAQQQQQQQ